MADRQQTVGHRINVSLCSEISGVSLIFLQMETDDLLTRDTGIC